MTEGEYTENHISYVGLSSFKSLLETESSKIELNLKSDKHQSKTRNPKVCTIDVIRCNSNYLLYPLFMKRCKIS